MKKKLVVFDLDGTLLNTLGDIRRAINYVLSSYDIPQISEEETRKAVGHGLRNALIQVVNKSGAVIEDNDFSLMNELLVASYMKHPCVYTKPYPGIEELLLWLNENGLKVAVASNKKESVVKEIIKAMFSQIKFAFVLGENGKYPLKPDPEGILNEMDKLGLKSDDIIYIGDSEVDALTAENLKCDSIIVNYGFRTPEELNAAGIKESVGSPEEVMNMIKERYL